MYVKERFRTRVVVGLKMADVVEHAMENNVELSKVDRALNSKNQHFMENVANNRVSVIIFKLILNNLGCWEKRHELSASRPSSQFGGLYNWKVRRIRVKWVERAAFNDVTFVLVERGSAQMSRLCNRLNALTAWEKIIVQKPDRTRRHRRFSFEF